MGLRPGRRSSHFCFPLPRTNLGFPILDSLVYLGCHATNYRDYAHVRRHSIHALVFLRLRTINSAVQSNMAPAMAVAPVIATPNIMAPCQSE
jgi:hypothetical protein